MGATHLTGFAPNTRQVADGCVEGRVMLATKPDNHDSRPTLAQIKGGHLDLSALRDFEGVADRDRAPLGWFVTVEPVTSPAARKATVKAGKGPHFLPQAGEVAQAADCAPCPAEQAHLRAYATQQNRPACRF